MSDYTPPVQDMQFVLHELLNFQSEVMDAETMDAILDEASKLASQVLAPLNRTGDQEPATLKDGAVSTSPGFKEAYAQYRDGGWNAVPFAEEYGGQALPYGVAFPVQEMWQGANMAFGLCPLLNQGAVEAILSHGSQEQKDFYLPKLISGEWTGTMNLTEPHAGSDLGLLRTKAEKQDNGTYRISGQKIWITYGEHDMAENIIHLVLARLPDAPEDVKGISLFIVPKFLEDGTRNDLQCIGLDHKLGIHASPTCVMQYGDVQGDKKGAVGYLIGAENEGLKYMFTMMNNARLSVGLQGVAIAERAYQAAKAYAAERVQGKSFTSGERVTIDHHADVQRMLLTMRALIEAGRALTYEAAIALDEAEHGNEVAQAKVDLLTPIVKAWCTDIAQEVTSLAVQVHGGSGFIEETGVAQYYRDARILPIYEGTNGIQAADLAFRKTLRDQGRTALGYIDQIKAYVPDEYQAGLKNVITQLTDKGNENKLDWVGAMSSPYLKAFGIIAGGAMMEKSAEIAAQKGGDDFHQSKVKTAAFYRDNILPLALGHLHIASKGPQSFTTG